MITYFFPNEIAKDVFVASTIVRPKNGTIPVRILNTREEVVQIKQFKPVMKPLSEFLLLQKTDFETNGREKLLQENIDLKHLKGAERSNIEQICRKFSDIFLLPGDKLTYANIFEQRIPLKPRTSPVYKKPYRIPHSQRTIVEEEVDKMLKHDIEEAFNTLRQKLIESEVLEFPDFSEDNIFEVVTDASKYGIGAVLQNSSGIPVLGKK